MNVTPISFNHETDEILHENFATIRQSLFRWFNKNKRSFPWREINDPYAVWVSEIMLQQTTTITTLGYYERFLKRFPDVHALAQSDHEELLAYWEGLGYYRRASYLHRSAKIVVDQYQGIFPDTFEQLIRLPGIGRYTAGAILSFAFDKPYPILETNTIRLYSRLIALEDDPHSRLGNDALWQFAQNLLPAKRVGRFNLALLDLGSLVCKPTAPECDRCPIRTECIAAQRGTQHLHPALKAKPPKEERCEVAFLVKSENRILLTRLPDAPRWSHLWDFPRLLQTNDCLPQDDPLLLRALEQIPECQSRRIGAIIRTINHLVTRFKIRLHLCETYPAPNVAPAKPSSDSLTKTIPLAAGNLLPSQIEHHWFTIDEIQQLPLNSTARKLMEWIRGEGLGTRG